MMIAGKLSTKTIDKMLKESVGIKDETKASLKSNYHLRQMLDRMEDGLGASSCRESQLDNMVWNAQHTKEPIEFWHRDIIECGKWLLQQRAYTQYLSYAPEKRFEDDGNRVYSEMYTADWWWERQSSLDAGDTMVPMIFVSDVTHLTNFSGDKKAWTVYMTIGNLPATVRMAPSQHGILLVALLPIPVKMRDVRIAEYNTQKEYNRMIQQHILHHVLRPLIDANRHMSCAQCADGYFRHSVASPAAWIADYPEHRDLHNISNGYCYYNTDTRASRECLTCHNVHHGPNVLWDLDCVVNHLPKPDLLHTMQPGMLKHLLGWLQDFLKQHKRLELFNIIWLSVPPYLDMAQPQKAYEEVSNWQGKEIKPSSHEGLKERKRWGHGRVVERDVEVPAAP
ncbi:hypothetical protein BZA05DRAFT_445175 [Tricharina praecox]|uniref:uncharacterized protein n=1 Tax=Tricharina praecox TaxID=43433 RepID=UPI00221E5CA5|nr:uncharacterized protein BZA05DRAFT_445175 [Tricharina praecox]KAI5852013.1 hypothetical protein BZA05DRAFT_445175 [Tricharina praecox]